MRAPAGRRPVHRSRPEVSTSDHREAGLTLVEMLITMAILALFLALFSTALMAMLRSVQKQTGVVAAQTSTRTAFEMLDKQIRYADAVTTPGTVAGVQWIEWRVPDPKILVAQSASQERCFQWRATTSTGALQYRSWIVPTTGGVAAPGWISVATGLVIGTVPVFTTSIAGLQSAPFSLPATGQTYSLVQAQVGVALSVSLKSPAGRSVASSVFTALNSDATPDSVCTEVART
jgi:prepilin-type N-terminal cleavage/methylation domain-containing protein